MSLVIWKSQLHLSLFYLVTYVLTDWLADDCQVVFPIAEFMKFLIFFYT